MKATKSRPWVIVHSSGTTTLAKEPKKVPGGYKDQYGTSYIGRNVLLLNVHTMHKEEFLRYFGYIPKFAQHRFKKSIFNYLAK